VRAVLIAASRRAIRALIKRLARPATEEASNVDTFPERRPSYSRISGGAPRPGAFTASISSCWRLVGDFPAAVLRFASASSNLRRCAFVARCCTSLVIQFVPRALRRRCPCERHLVCSERPGHRAARASIRSIRTAPSTSSQVPTCSPAGSRYSTGAASLRGAAHSARRTSSSPTRGRPAKSPTSCSTVTTSSALSLSSRNVRSPGARRASRTGAPACSARVRRRDGT
jgi:hypothetical protein